MPPYHSTTRTTTQPRPFTGKKYVPPHLRNSQSTSGGDKEYNNSNSGGGFDNRRSNNDARGSYSSFGGDSRRNSGGYDRGGNDDSAAASARPPPQQNTRWSGVSVGEGGGGERRGANYNGYGGGGGGGGGGGRRDSMARVNERGFHGDMKPDKRLEQRLFDREGKQTTGINFDNYDAIPIEVSGHDIPDPIETYAMETIGEDLFRNTQLCGYDRPTPVQKYSIPIGILGRDLMACAQTGSGKTAGFLFPILMSMIKNGGRQSSEQARSRRTNPEALVLAPTRELAQQIHDEALRFSYCTGIAPVVIYGGADVRDQLRQIERGCDLLVATPGRLVDLIERGRLGMDNVRFLVLDEADRMLDMGFEVRCLNASIH